MEVKTLGLHNIVDLNYLAEEVLHELRTGGYKYDDEGNYLAHSMTPEELSAKIEEFVKEAQNNNYLEFTKEELIRYIKDNY